MTGRGHEGGGRGDWALAAWMTDLHAAAAALTRLPLPPPPAAATLAPRRVRAFPVIGALTGLAAGGVFFAGHDVGLPPAVNAVLAVAALVLIGGHLDEGDNRAAAPFLIATLLKIAALAVIGDPATPGGGPAMAVMALAGAGALSHAAALVLAPDPAGDEASDAEGGPAPAPTPAKVVIFPPDGTAIPGGEDAETAEGNGHDMGPAASALGVAAVIGVIALGLMGALVAAGGAAVGAFVAPRILAREIEAGLLGVALALQQSAEVWALLALAVSLRL